MRCKSSWVSASGVRLDDTELGIKGVHGQFKSDKLHGYSDIESIAADFNKLHGYCESETGLNELSMARNEFNDVSITVVLHGMPLVGSHHPHRARCDESCPRPSFFPPWPLDAILEES